MATDLEVNLALYSDRHNANSESEQSRAGRPELYAIMAVSDLRAGKTHESRHILLTQRLEITHRTAIRPFGARVRPSHPSTCKGSALKSQDGAGRRGVRNPTSTVPLRLTQCAEDT